MKKKLKSFFILALLASVIFAIQTVPLYAEAEEEQAVEQEEEEQQQQMLTSMVELKPGDVAVSWNGRKMTLKEMLELFDKSGKLSSLKKAGEEKYANQSINGLNVSQQQFVKRALQGLIRANVLLALAKEQGITVTDEDMKIFTQKWREAGNDTDISEYLNKFPQASDNDWELTGDKVLLVMKYSLLQTESVKLPEVMVKQSYSKIAAIRDTFGKVQMDELATLKELAKDPALNTDEGFARLAREYSQGADADNGGVINIALTRSEIAEVNDGQEFTTKVGETSPLIETETTFRYIRVLGIVPGKMPGEPEKLRIAQIMLPKRELEDLPTEEQVRVSLQNKLSEVVMNEQVAQQLAKSDFACPLFPEILVDWPMDENSRLLLEQMRKLNNNASKTNNNTQPETK